MNVEPQSVCTVQVRQAISVRRASMPRKQARYELPEDSWDSRAVVCAIVEMVAAGLKSGSAERIVRRRAAYASVCWF